MSVIKDFFTTQSKIVVFDTEFTTWEGAMARKWSGPGEYRELVQIAAQKIDVHTNTILDSFECLVAPTINPILSDYFVELTHITQAAVEESGLSFIDAYTQFMAWSEHLPKYSFSQTLESRSDRGVLEDNIALYNLDIVLPKEEFGTLTAVFQAAGVDTTAYSSGELYRAFELSLAGHVHNAMHDVDSLVASLFAVKERWLQE